MSENPIRVVVVEDHPLYRHGLCAMLAATPDMTVIGEIGDGNQAPALVQELQPDVVLMDVQLPGQSGIAATRIITANSPQVRVLILSLFQDDDSVFAALRAGARGYILKDADEEDVIRAIRAIAAGESLFGPEIATRLLTWFSQSRWEASTAFPQLTSRERQILDLIATGMSNAAIADELFVSAKTIANSVSSIFAKLQVSDRSEAIVRAREAGLGRKPS